MNNSFLEMTRLELLLESLIKMVGRTNDKVDDLSKRVNQLEMCVREMNLEDGRVVKRTYSFIAEADPHKPIPKASKRIIRT